MATAGADAVLLTKVADSRDVARAAAIIDRLGSKTRIWCMVETASSLFNLDTIATAPRMSALFMGTGDLLLDFRTRTFGVTGAEAVGDPLHVDPLLYARSRVVMTARALGLGAIDSAMGRLDIDSALSSAQKAFQLGFDGKLIATPSHISVVHEAYGPTPADIAWAHRVIEALERAERDGIGSAVVDGEPMDGPYLGYAHGVLTRAEHVEAAAVAASRHGASAHRRAGNQVRR
jgi:citrate lyase beta subunit